LVSLIKNVGERGHMMLF